MSKTYLVTRAIVRAVVYIGIGAIFLASSWWSLMFLWALTTKP